MVRDRILRIALICVTLIALISALTLCVFSACYGTLNQDEGWYLYAARCVADGMHPYRDFFYTQAPFMPWFYSWFDFLWYPEGVLGGRIFTTVLGFLSALCVGAMAARAVPKQRALEAATAAFAMVACNLYHVYFTTIPKTYALASLCLYAGFLILTLCFFRKRTSHSMMSRMWALPAGFLIALAVGTRLSLILILPITALTLLINCRKSGSAFFWFALGGTIGMLLLFAPVYLNAHDQFLFSQTFHIAREGSQRDLMLVAGSLSRFARAYMTHCALLFALVCALLLYGRKKESPFCVSNDGYAYHGDLWLPLWFISFVAVFVLHLSSPHPYDDYQVPIIGLLSAALTGWVINRVDDGKLRFFFVIGTVASVLLGSFSSPLIQQWLTDGQDRFWIVKKELSDIKELQLAAREIKELADDDDTLLTQDLYLAIEAGMKVPSGMEMGAFGYFPKLSDADAERYHVLNRRALTDLLESAPTEVAAFSGYGLAIQAPVMERVPYHDYQSFITLLGKNYDFVGEVENFGQNNTLLQILKRREQLAE